MNGVDEGFGGVATSGGKTGYIPYAEGEDVTVGCVAGSSRPVSGYVLNGVLGVCRRELETDWESTFYPRIPDENKDPNYWCRESHFNNGFAKYGDASTPWNDRVILYLKDCGITDAEIEAFRKIMLEDK